MKANCGNHTQEKLSEVIEEEFITVKNTGKRATRKAKSNQTNKEIKPCKETNKHPLPTIVNGVISTSNQFATLDDQMQSQVNEREMGAANVDTDPKSDSPSESVGNRSKSPSLVLGDSIVKGLRQDLLARSTNSKVFVKSFSGATTIATCRTSSNRPYARSLTRLFFMLVRTIWLLNVQTRS